MINKLASAFLSGMSFLAFSAAPAFAADHGHIVFQIKQPAQGCSYVNLKLKDMSGSASSIKPKSFLGSEIPKKMRKKEISNMLKFHVPPGQYQMASIDCLNMDKSIKTTATFKPNVRKLKAASVSYDGLNYVMEADKTIYLGAIEFIPYFPSNSLPLAMDKSALGEEREELKPGTYETQFLTLKYNPSALTALEGAPTTTTPDTAPAYSAMPAAFPPDGKSGKLAVQIRGCSYKGNIYFNRIREDGTMDKKSVKFEIKRPKTGETSIKAEKVDPGRYQFRSIRCEFGGRVMNGKAMGISQVDVFPGETSYAGEIQFKEVFGVNSLSRNDGTFRYKILINDRFEEAKADLGDNIVNRISGMNDPVQLLMSSAKTSMNSNKSRLSQALKAYDKARSEAAKKHIVPGMSSP